MQFFLRLQARWRSPVQGVWGGSQRAWARAPSTAKYIRSFKFLHAAFDGLFPEVQSFFQARLIFLRGGNFILDGAHFFV
ncbi:MAG: hypothetical protein C4321_09660 [Chloroflexota bacterium]